MATPLTYLFFVDSNLPVPPLVCSASDLQTRKKYVSLVETARDRGAKVFVFSRSASQSEIVEKNTRRHELYVKRPLYAGHAWYDGVRAKRRAGSKCRSHYSLAVASVDVFDCLFVVM